MAKTARKPRILPFLVTDDIADEPGRARRSTAVRSCAGALAKRLGASIDLLHVEDVYLYPVRTPSYEPLIKEYLAGRKASLRRGAESFGAPVRPLFVDGAPVRTILKLSSKRNAYELVVMGTHGRKGLGRWVLGSVAEEVIRHSVIPVMTVGPEAQKNASKFLGGEAPVIFVPTGLTPNSDRAEEYGAWLAARLGGSVVLFHSLHETLHPVIQTAFAAPGGQREMYGMIEELAEDAARKLRRRAAKISARGVPATSLVDERSFSASESILKAARAAKASLIVMGTHGRSMALGAFFGRTARDVVLSAPIPVVTVRSRAD